MGDTRYTQDASNWNVSLPGGDSFYTKEEEERLMESLNLNFNTQMQGIGAAGAASKVEDRPTLPKPDDYVGSNIGFLDWLGGTYENRSYNEGILQGWFNPQYYRKQYEDMSVKERFVFDQEWMARQDPGAYFFNKAKMLFPLPISLLPDAPQGTSYNTDYPPPVEDILNTNVRGDPLQVLPEHPGYPETSPGNPHKDKPVDFNFFDWLNEILAPLEPAPEKPEYTPWEMPEYKPPLPPREEWASMYPDSYKRAGDGVEIISTRYPGDLFGTVTPLIYGIGAKRNAGKIKYGYNSKGEMYALTDAEGNYLRNPIVDYSKLRSPYPNALNIYALGKGINKYVGEPGYENLLGLESPEGDTTSWMRAQHAAIDAQMQAEYQQELIDKKERYNTENELAKREHRSSYDEMVAEMVETERLRQEEYAAERQRYTDRYNENPDFYGNLFSGGDDGILPSDRTLSTDMTRHPGQELGAIDSAILSAIPFINALGGGEPLIDYPHRIGPDVGQPIDNPFGFSDVGQPISQPGYISQQDLLLNQNRPGGGIGLSEQILNQAKPGAYLYPGMLN